MAGENGKKNGNGQIAFPNAVIRNVVKFGVHEMEDAFWARCGKVRVHDGIGAVPAALSCSCDPWCGARYFPWVRHFRDLSWSDVAGLLRRSYGDYDYERWCAEMEAMKKLARDGKAKLARAQGSSPLYPTFLPIPIIVENALNHDFHEYMSAENPDKAERFRLLRAALQPMVID